MQGRIMKILLIEPSYRNKYPPLGLMKISAFHKRRGDEVHFVKGLDRAAREKQWDRIYITTLFSFHWAETIKTIRYYEFSVKNPRNLFIGGPTATLMAEEIQRETGFATVQGLLNERGKLCISGDQKIDSMTPDYSILDEISYKYPANDAYYAYMTRGCIRKCKFCAVPKIEPSYVGYIPLKKQIKMIADEYGERKDLLLLDNNILASAQFDRIIQEIKDIGFHKEAKFKGKSRYVDFNQGIDLRLLTKEKMKKLAELSIYPMRIAFDHINLKEEYVKKIKWAAEFGIKRLSNYVLYNYNDRPEDFYERLRINVELNAELGTNIYSFPMKYIPVNAKDRSHVGKHWTARYLRSVQCILQATHGVVGTRKDFFEAAFGRNVEEFMQLLIMPFNYIIYRESYKNNGAKKWAEQLNALNGIQMLDLLKMIQEKKYDESVLSDHAQVNAVLKHYGKRERIVEKIKSDN